MARYLYVAMSDPLPDRESDLEAWYDQVHLRQVIDVPGFVSAQRFTAIETCDGPIQRRRTLVIYELETDDPSSVISALRARRGSPQLAPCDALDTQSMFAQVYKPAAPAAETIARLAGARSPLTLIGNNI